jgi:tRNA-specific adenosine deaminase 1
MKCLPQAKVAQAQGNVLHDWHAEVLAIRAFNRWMLDECAELAVVGRQGRNEFVDWIAAPEHNDGPPFALRNDLSIHMFVSQAPCGDASMELTMASQPSSSAWTHAAPSADPDAMLGRGHFDQLGIVRRKPSRPDAPATLSKSCSDKLAMMQVTGLLSGLTAALIRPENVYLSSLVSPEQEIVPEAVERAFGSTGRMNDMVGMEDRGGYAFKPFEVRSTSRSFAFTKPTGDGYGAVGSNLSALCTPRRQEVLINGVLQGRKQCDVRGASCVSRRAMWRLALGVAMAAGMPELVDMLRKRTYGETKRALGKEREEVKERAKGVALNGWRRNEGDDGWTLDGGGS